MKKIFCSLGLMAMICIFSAAPLQAANIINVPAGGSIQAAINAAAPGDTINVKAGTYDVAATIIVNKAVTISGPAGGGATVQGTQKEAASIFKITASNVTIQNLNITVTSIFTGYPTTEDLGALINIPAGSLTGITITGNTLYVPAQIGAMTSWVARAICVGSGNAGISITGNTIYNTRNGVVGRYNCAVNISNNTIYNTKGGIMNYTGSQTDADARTMSNNSWGTTHNEWDIVWNSGGAPYAPDYSKNVLVLSGANNDAYVLSLIPTYTNPTGNRSHVFVNATIGTLTIHPANGNQNLPYKTIALGIDAVVPGGKVYVAAGTYREKVVLNKSVTVTGDRGDVNVAGPGPNAPILDGDLNNDGFPDKGDGFTIPKNTNLSGITVEGFIIQNFGNGGGGNGVGVGVISWENTSSNVTIRDNLFRDLGYNGVYVGTDSDDMQSNWLVQRNIVIGAPYAGIELTDVTNSQVLDNEITAPATIFVDLGDAGVGIEIAARARNGSATTSNIQVKGNTITGVFSGGSRAGINLLSRAYGSNRTAVLSDITVEGNVVSGSGTRGIYAVAESRNGGTSSIENLIITSNTLAGNAAGIEVGGVFTSPKANGNYGSDANIIQIRYNNLAGNTVGLINSTTAKINATSNWWGTNDGNAIASQISGIGAALVTFSPWLTSPEGICSSSCPAGYGSAAIEIQYLIADVEAINLKKSREKKLIHELDKSLKEVLQCDQKNADKGIEKFIKEVQKKKIAKHLTEAEAADLLKSANDILSLLGGL